MSKLMDELWVAEKFQSNLEIAGSPRNIFRYSLVFVAGRGRALTGLRQLRLSYPNKLRILSESYQSQNARAKLRVLKGNSPDRRLRSPIII